MSTHVSCMGMSTHVSCVGMSMNVSCMGMSTHVNCVGMSTHVSCVCMSKHVSCEHRVYKGDFLLHIVLFLFLSHTTSCIPFGQLITPPFLRFL